MVRMTVITVIVALLGCGGVAHAVEVSDLDAMLVRTDTHDVLVLRPWIPADAAHGVWLWPVPPGTRVEVRGDIGIDALRSAVWMGSIPLSPTNGTRLSPLCGMAIFLGVVVQPVRAYGICRDGTEFTTLLRRAGLVPESTDRARFEAIVAGGDEVAVIAWQLGDDPASGRPAGHDPKPLEAVVLFLPGYADGIAMPAPGLRRGCLGDLLTIGRRPVVPDPASGSPWETSLLVRDEAADARAAARLAGVTDVDDAWCVCAWTLQYCDDATTLRPVLLDPARDLLGPAARTAASWCALGDDPRRIDALRGVLADTTRSGMALAFAVWAWSQHDTADRIAQLERWSHHRDPLVRSEALLALADVDSSHALDRDIAILGGITATDPIYQVLINQAGMRVVAGVDRQHRQQLRALADADGGWIDWAIGESVWRTQCDLARGPVDSPTADNLTPGDWAVAALAVVADGDAARMLPRGLVESALLNVARARFGCRYRQSGHGFSDGYWNGDQILRPRDPGTSWPTLTRLEIALATQPRTRDVVIRAALDDRRLPDIAATVLLASLIAWRPEDEAMAIAILGTATTIRDVIPTRFRTAGQRDVVVGIPWAAAGAAYVLAQHGLVAPILAALARNPTPELRAELVFALALVREEDPRATAAIEAWRDDVAALASDARHRAIADVVTERLRHIGDRDPQARLICEPRFGCAFERMWMRARGARR